MPSTAARAALTLLALAGLAAAPLSAQRRAPAGPPRLTVSAYGGRFIDFGGFSDDQDTFFNFEDATAFGGSLHYRPGQGAQYGVDVLWTRPAYRRFDRTTRVVLASGNATAVAAMASARFSGGGGPLGLYLAGEAGAFFWNAAELDGRQTDPALVLGVGLDYSLRGLATLFGEYSQWWVYHEKDESVVKNTANHTVIRFGLRYAF
jgi:hypothetical protein